MYMTLIIVADSTVSTWLHVGLMYSIHVHTCTYMYMYIWYHGYIKLEQLWFPLNEIHQLQLLKVNQGKAHKRWFIE